MILKITQMLNYILLFSLCFMILAVHHCFFRHIAKSPYVAVDDSLANISVSLSNLGRYGFLSSPRQANSMEIRSYAFFNYGPWPFFVGAGLDWLFGTSYKILRYIHLLGIMLISIIGYGTIKKYSFEGACFFVFLTIYVYSVGQWPMFRPDIIVVLWSAVAIYFAERALCTNSLYAWFGLGFSIASAVTTHQIAWILGIWGGLLWLVKFKLPNLPESDGVGNSHSLLNFLCFFSGNVLACLIFLFAINFRIASLYHLWTSYADAIHDGKITYLNILSKHLTSAWSTFPLGMILCLYGTIGIGLIMIVIRFYVTRKWSPKSMYLLIPTVSMSILYPASLIEYNNYHAGYVILVQVSSLYAFIATWAGIVSALYAKWPCLKSISNALISLILIVLVVSFSKNTLSQSTRWMKYAEKSVDFDEYSREVLNPLPIGASAWGDLRFGLESGLRIQLVQFGEGVYYANLKAPSTRNEVAPDSLILKTVLQHSLFTVLQNFNPDLPSSPTTPLSQIQKLFPGEKYKLTHLVYAPPYGTTRIYYRESALHQNDDIPTVSVNIDGSRQWVRKIDFPIDVAFTKSEPADIKVNLAGRYAQATALQTIQGELPKGYYLIAVHIDGKQAKESILVASESLQCNGFVGGLQLPFEIAPFWGGESNVYFLVNHDGGPIFISHFCKDIQTFQIESVRPIYIQSKTETTIPLPHYKDWIVKAKNATWFPLENKGVHVIGDRQKSGIQIITPPIAVPSKSKMELHLKTYGITSHIAIGILDSSMDHWLVFPNSNSEVIEFTNKKNRFISIAVVNNNSSELDKQGEFQIFQGGYLLIKETLDDLYVDRLTDIVQRKEKLVN